ncbi:MAG: class I adenylate-forming enzyme family protein [Steroidobacteraceae bacterium]
MSLNERQTLWAALHSASPLAGRSLWGAHGSLQLTHLIEGTSLGSPLEGLHGRSLLLLMRDPLASAAALIELDGIARRLVLCPPDLSPEHLPHVLSVAAVDSIVSDRTDIHGDLLAPRSCVPCRPCALSMRGARPDTVKTDWILFTSGTTGVPKMVLHDLETLAGGIRPGAELSRPAVWSTYYDIRRFGGLQIFLRAVLGGGSLVLTSPDESVDDFLSRAGGHRATHVTGTPSHWRRVLMGPGAQRIRPQYVRLSGEIADQAILDALRAAYPQARVAHAFATTEAGLAFEVNDGLEGLPAGFCQESRGGDVEMAVVEGTLRIRSPRTARDYLGDQPEPLLDSSGFVDTGDLLERRGNRYHFAGRRGGIINVGGLKVHPEEVEAVINRHPRVRMSLVRARRNPITGALVVADVVLSGAWNGDRPAERAVKDDILKECRRYLAAYKVPAAIRFVPSLPLTAAGKVARPNA